MPHTNTHELKTWKRYFEEILSGNKKFELRKNDREFKIGDIIKLSEYNNSEIDHERLIDISNRAMMLWYRANKTYESK